MGVISKRGNYWLDYRFNGHRYRKKVGPYKALADSAWAKIQTEIAENRFLDVKKTKQVRFEDFADRYLNLHCKVNHRSIAAVGQIGILKRHFNGKYLHEITPVMIERFKAERLKEKVCPATANRALTCLKAIFNKAIKWEEFDGTNPVNGVKFFKEENQKIRFLEKEEISKLIQNASDQIKPLITIAISTGMRKGELLNLKWQDIDFKQGLIHLLVTKSGRKREIPMSPKVQKILLDIPRQSGCPYVFVNRNGKQWKDVRRGFTEALEAAGITTHTRFHDLRHTCATQMNIQGTDLITIKEHLGHADIKTTMIYAHTSKKLQVNAVKSLDAILTCDPASNPEVNKKTVRTSPEVPAPASCN